MWLFWRRPETGRYDRQRWTIRKVIAPRTNTYAREEGVSRARCCETTLWGQKPGSTEITTTHHGTWRQWDDEKREKRYRMMVESWLVCVGNSLATVRGWCLIVRLGKCSKSYISERDVTVIEFRLTGWRERGGFSGEILIDRWGLNPVWPIEDCAGDFSVGSSKNAEGQISLARCFGMLIDRWGVSPIWRAFRGLGFAFVSAMFVKEIDEGKKS